jgi:hypothetical protein
VEKAMAKLAGVVGRAYGLFEYYGHPKPTASSS